MTKITRSTTIYVPVEKLFEFIDSPERVGVFSIGVSRVRDVKRSEGVGDVMTLTYSVLGMHFDEKFTYVEYEKPTRLVSTVQGPLTGTFRVTLIPEASNQTSATLEVEYEMATTLQRAVNKLMLESMNEKNLDRTLENIKRMAESELTFNRKNPAAIA